MADARGTPSGCTYSLTTVRAASASCASSIAPTQGEGGRTSLVALGAHAIARGPR